MEQWDVWSRDKPMHGNWLLGAINTARSQQTTWQMRRGEAGGSGDVEQREREAVTRWSMKCVSSMNNTPSLAEWILQVKELPGAPSKLPPP